MTTIERAAQRLAELQNAGIAVPDGILAGQDPRAAAVPARPLSLEPEEKLPFVASPPMAPDHKRMADRLAGCESRSSGKTSAAVTLDLHQLRMAGMLTPDTPRSKLANELRVIKRPLIENARGRAGSALSRANVIMVTSSVPQEGKTFVALNLAISIAMEVDKSVLLVDGDVVTPGVLRFLGLEDHKGLTDLLADPRLDPSDVLLRTNIERLTLLPAGGVHERASELLTSEAMPRLLDELATRYADRIVIFDSPPLLATSEARVLASHVGQVVLVARADMTSHGALRESLALLEQCPMVCTLLNGASTPPLGSYYGYSDGADTKPA